jgi:site-specific DNA-methyltransferase (adenine-specific)
MDDMIEKGIKVDMILTSPPYDNMTTYGNTLDGSTWNFDVFKEIAKRMKSILREGGVICWVVGDQVKNGCKSGTTARQALYMMDELGLKWNDTIIYEKNSSAFPASRKSKRWTNIYESILVFTKGKIRDDIELLCDKPNKWAGFTNWGTNSNYDKDGNLVKTEDIKAVPEFSKRTNIWKYTTACEKDKNKHPAVFPEKLAVDLILSYSVEGDMIFDPFLGSGTTIKAAMTNNRSGMGSEIVPEYYQMSKDRIMKYLTENYTLTENIL